MTKFAYVICRIPGSFFILMDQDDTALNKRFMDNNLLLRSMPCSKGKDGCSGIMRPVQRTGIPSGATLRCNKNRNHEVAIRTNSFFENSKLHLDHFHVCKILPWWVITQARIFFRRCALQDHGCWLGIFYKRNIQGLFSTEHQASCAYREVEIDEFVFGRKVKFHRGNPNKGLKVSSLDNEILFFNIYLQIIWHVHFLTKN
jgi:hypothetical protein